MSWNHTCGTWVVNYNNNDADGTSPFLIPSENCEKPAPQPNMDLLHRATANCTLELQIQANTLEVEEFWLGLTYSLARCSLVKQNAFWNELSYVHRVLGPPVAREDQDVLQKDVNKVRDYRVGGHSLLKNLESVVSAHTTGWCSLHPTPCHNRARGNQGRNCASFNPSPWLSLKAQLVRSINNCLSLYSWSLEVRFGDNYRTNNFPSYSCSLCHNIHLACILSLPYVRCAMYLGGEDESLCLCPVSDGMFRESAVIV